MINNKGRKGKRDPERAIMYYYSIIASEISNVVKLQIIYFYIYTIYIHKAKIQHYVIVFVIGRK